MGRGQVPPPLPMPAVADRRHACCLCPYISLAASLFVAICVVSSARNVVV